MISTDYIVIKYDMLGFETKKDNDYSNLNVAAPECVAEADDIHSAEDKCAELTAHDSGEQIDIVMKNGKAYKGNRYVYRVAVGG